MSEFRVPVIRITGIQKHPNADTLSIVQVDGENVVFKTGDFSEGQLAIYVPVDAVVPATVPGTEFLGERPKDRRIRAKRLRGVYSEGLLLPYTVIPGVSGNPYASLTFDEGYDVASMLGIVKHEDAIPETWGTSVSGASVPHKKGILGHFFHWCFRDELRVNEKDPGCIPFYDIEPLKRYERLLTPGERVIVTEKLHGTNARFCYLDGKLYVGSRNMFWRDLSAKKVLFRERLGEFVRRTILRRAPRGQRKQNLYWHTAKQYDLANLLAPFERFAFYGEIYGEVQDLKYGAKPGQTWFRVFDIFDTKARMWLPWRDVALFCAALGLKTVPVLYDGPYDYDTIAKLVEGDSVLGGNIREGIVVKPADSHEDPAFGRVILKWVSQAYKLRKNGTELH